MARQAVRRQARSQVYQPHGLLGCSYRDKESRPGLRREGVRIRRAVEAESVNWGNGRRLEGGELQCPIVGGREYGGRDGVKGVNREGGDGMGVRVTVRWFADSGGGSMYMFQFGSSAFQIPEMNRGISASGYHAAPLSHVQGETTEVPTIGLRTDQWQGNWRQTCARTPPLQ